MSKNDSVHPIGAAHGGSGSSGNKSGNGHDTSSVTTAWKWRPVVGQEGRYEVSERGDVRRLRLLSRRGHWLSPKEMKLSRGNNGYLRVSIDGTVRLVHHVVAEAFIGPRPPGALLRHLDDNKDNNHYSNLAYGSSGDNMRDCLANGNHSQATRTHCIHGHEFTPENTRVYTRTNGKTQRSCRECYRIYKRKKYKEVRGNAYNGRF